MPELPEVETIVNGLKPLVKNHKITQVIVRQPNLRWTLPDDFAQKITNQTIVNIFRRSKYLIFELENLHILWHLGMSGSLGFADADATWQKHQHLGLTLVDKSGQNSTQLRYLDPRRFGFVLLTEQDPLQHKLLNSLAPEPLTPDFNAEYLFAILQNKKQAIKTFIMDSHKVVGVGNIYANEALFAAKISPLQSAGKLTFMQTQTLVSEIKQVLQKAIKAGGTSLKDYKNIQGKAGYFSQELQVYARDGQDCNICQTPIVSLSIAKRNSFYCPNCQKLDET